MHTYASELLLVMKECWAMCQEGAGASSLVYNCQALSSGRDPISREHGREQWWIRLDKALQKSSTGLHTGAHTCTYQYIHVLN